MSFFEKAVPDCGASKVHLVMLRLGILIGLSCFVAGGNQGVAADLSPAEKDQGFVDLFDGKSLKGWIGGEKGFVVENGVITCRPPKDGKLYLVENLFTEKEYKDFIFRFEFRLTPGANSGVGIRSPLKGDPAFVGMEVQIIDDSAPRYKNIQPWQKHGSIYGVVAARTGYLKPVGEWNSEEIICQGRQVKVILNGTIIVDADLDKAGSGKTLDKKDHPGLRREKGHIGFLGHTSRVEFRNIRIKDLSPRER